MVFYSTEPAPSSSLDSKTIRDNFNFLDNTLINHVSASSAHNLDAIDIDVIGSPVITNAEDLLDSINAAGVISGGAITDDGDATITVASGSGLIRTWDCVYAPLVSFEWASSSSIAIGDDALTYVYIDYNSGSPLIKTTTDRNDINDNSEICIAHVYKEAGILDIHDRTGGVSIEDFQRRVDHRIKELRNFERASGMVTFETGIRNIGITAGNAWRGLDDFSTSAKDTSGSGDVFTYWYRDGGVGWTKDVDQTQIDNTQYDDGSGGLATLGVGRYGVHWVFLCNDDEHFSVVYGQGSYKLAEAQNAEVPSGLPDKLDNFDILIAKIIILKNAPTFTEVATAFEIFFPRSEVINHNDLGNIDGGQVDEYYHLTDAEHGALVDGGSADGYHTHPDSGSADTLDSVCERGNVTDQDITGADIKADGDIYINDDETDADAIAHFKTSGSVDETLRWDKTDNRFEFSDDLHIDGDLYFSYNKKINIPTFQLIPIFWALWGEGTNFYIGEDSDKFITISTPSGHVSFFEDVTIAQHLYIGNESSASNKVIYANNGDAHLPNLRYNEFTNKWQFSNDGENWSDIGSGGNGGVQSVEFDVGGLALGDGTAGSAAPALSLLTTSDAQDPQCRTFCLRFDDSTDEHVFWQHRLRTNYSSGGRIIVQFYNVTTQGDDDNTAYFAAALQAVTPGDATDMTALDIVNAGGWAGTLKTLDAGSDGPRLYELTIDMTSNLDGMAAGDFIQFGLRRTVAEDDGAGDMAVITITFEYNY